MSVHAKLCKFIDENRIDSSGLLPISSQISDMATGIRNILKENLLDELEECRSICEKNSRTLKEAMRILEEA